VVQKNSTKSGLHAGNTKFKARNEEWISELICLVMAVMCGVFVCLFVCFVLQFLIARNEKRKSVFCCATPVKKTTKDRVEEKLDAINRHEKTECIANTFRVLGLFKSNVFNNASQCGNIHLMQYCSVSVGEFHELLFNVRDKLNINS
jgi:hypothetical protein